jgi:hypothetical protein
MRRGIADVCLWTSFIANTHAENARSVQDRARKSLTASYELEVFQTAAEPNGR